MKKLVLLLFLATLALPTATSAATISDCNPGTLNCLCPFTLGVDDVPQDEISTTNAARSCDQVCSALAEDILTVQWKLQCVVGENGITPIAFGALGSEQTLEKLIAESANEALSSSVIPKLGVDIPGLEFGEVTQGEIDVDGKATKVISSNFIGVYVDAIYTWLIGAGALIAVVILMIGGMEWILAAGSDEKISKAKTRIANAVTGMILLLSAYTIAYLIDPGTVSFNNLNIKYVKKIEFIGNETPFDLPITGSPVITSTSSNGGIGWNDFMIFDQTKFGHVPYGPNTPECFVQPTSTSHGSGNLKSSGCGVASFAGVISTLGSFTSPEAVAKIFWEEGLEANPNFRPVNNSGCGYNGTHPDAFIKSSLLEKNNLVGERIIVWPSPKEEAKKKILDELVAGNPVIVSYWTKVGPPPSGGHYVVLVGYEDDILLINNPWGATMEKKSASTFLPLIKTATVIKKK